MADLFGQLEEQIVLENVKAEFDDFLNIKAKAKELVPQINWVITQRKIDYIPNLILLRKHSSIQVRRKVATGLGFLSTKAEIEELQKWQLSESDRQTWLILESIIDKLSRGIDNQNLEKNIKVFSVSEALSLVKNLLGQGTYIIEGEIAEVRPVRQMYYFGIKDKQDSRIDCMCFVGAVLKAGFPLNDGLTIRVTGKFKLSKNSRIYFDIEKMELTGEGELLRNLKLLEKKLTNEGLFDQSRKRIIPTLPKNILLLASTSSAALTDFYKVLGHRRKGINIYHLPIKTQGVGAEYEILSKLEIVNQLTDKYDIDTVVLTRGGGSSDDLIVFNSEKVVRALYGINRPTVVAIGHERDTSLVELVADLRASTPSNAAELISLSTGQVFHLTENITNSLQRYFLDRKQSYYLTNIQLYSKIGKNINYLIQEKKSQCKQIDSFVIKLICDIKMETQSIWNKIHDWQKIYIRNGYSDLEFVEKLAESLKCEIDNFKLKNNKFIENINSTTRNNLSKIKSDFEILCCKIDMEDPKQVLAKGYTLTWQNGKVIESIKSLDKGDKITLQMQDGKVEI